ncbi:MAG: PTS fructose transporter subunit IIA [Gammaproteobacteria bacterium SHHR-1]|uniref:PTS sugar transporter subunit IIA n=1 Tax=Magnetovirga frankeli TaxID=947516 RepID=UPI0012940740|nr:PTS fructose transporter subunit IIA [gamma proteobacterium SS-5]
MSVVLMLMCHDDIGEAMLLSAENILGPPATRIWNLPVAAEDSLESIEGRARRMLERIHQPEGVLILTDLLGSTPCNVAVGLEELGQVRVVAGLNLPMLLRVMSHGGDDLPHLVDIALEGGAQGVLPGRPRPSEPARVIPLNKERKVGFG